MLLRKPEATMTNQQDHSNLRGCLETATLRDGDTSTVKMDPLVLNKWYRCYIVSRTTLRVLQFKFSKKAQLQVLQVDASSGAS
jgi:hypothetical protein